MFAHSLGAVVSQVWLHEYGPTSTVDPGDVEFILMGNSVRGYNGYYPHNNFTSSSGSPFVDRNLVGPITDTRYKVTDIAVQYDGYADWPDEPLPAAVANANAGKKIYHTMYNRFPLDRPDYKKFVEGNITYVWIPSDQWWSSPAKLAEIESAYHRPET